MKFPLSLQFEYKTERNGYLELFVFEYVQLKCTFRKIKSTPYSGLMKISTLK